MFRLRYIFILLLATLSLTLQVNAQNSYDGIGMGEMPPQDQMEGEGQPPHEGADSVAKRQRKPLESFYFDDSLRATPIFAWSVNPSYNTIDRQIVDTLIDNFQIDYAFMEQGVGSATIGNAGGASIPLNYFDRPRWENFSFVEVWAPYILTPDKVLFYNSKTPYSRLSYQMSGATSIEEQLFEFVLSHNISPSTSVNLVYSADGTRGMYQNQTTLDRNFSLNFAHTGKRYAIHGGYILNKGTIEENGGIVDDSEVLDTVLSSASQIDVNFDDSHNYYTGHTFWY
ncbi:MAG: putative porin, partial [Rikenellaceae bacterium]